MSRSSFPSNRSRWKGSSTIWIDAALDSTGVEIDSIMAVPRSLETAPSAHAIETALEQSGDCRPGAGSSPRE